MKQIIVEVSPTGEVKVEAVGYKGSGCKQATESIERALGTVGKRQLKPEFSQVNPQQLNQGAK